MRTLVALILALFVFALPLRATTPACADEPATCCCCDGACPCVVDAGEGSVPVDDLAPAASSVRVTLPPAAALPVELFGVAAPPAFSPARVDAAALAALPTRPVLCVWLT